MFKFKALEWEQMSFHPGLPPVLFAIIQIPFIANSHTGYLIQENEGGFKSKFKVSKLKPIENDKSKEPADPYSFLGASENLEEIKKIAQEDWESSIASLYFDEEFERIKGPL